MMNHEQVDHSEQNINNHKFDRRFTIPLPGMEGKFIAQGQFAGKSIGVLTSGGDAQGMNSALRAVVRMSIYCGCRVYLIREGYQGLVEGGDHIIEASWADVSGIIELGGTVIGSARCKAFREHEGRLRAAENLIKHGVTNLVVIGGDGSLTGANIFRVEWPELLKELVASKRISEELHDRHQRLNIVGIVGSIDNDFCGTDMTIGADSALRRVIEAVDAITTTAQSHQRCFIMEVMGRNCGYLALVSALAGEADWVFVPEMPPAGDWRELVSAKVKKNRAHGQRVTIILVAEGAIDQDCQPITCEEVKTLMVERLGLDTRVTVLGHVQRGGNPTAFDRILGIRMGAEAVLALMDADKNQSLPACVICLSGNQMVRLPLMRCVEKTRAVGEALRNKKFEESIELRGKSFRHNLDTYIKLSKTAPPSTTTKSHIRVAIMNVGAPACGINAAMRSFTRLAITHGYEVLGIKKGFRGLINDSIRTISWSDVTGWAGLGGSTLGIRRDTPKDVGIELVAEKILEHKISGLLIIGGFEAMFCLFQLEEARKDYPQLCIPILMLPATISNNLPGSHFSLGADTALNEICTAIDKVKQSALGSKRRLFVVETMGGHCGYLATMGGLAGGADAAYIFEEAFTIDDLRQDVIHLRAKMADNVERGLVLIAEEANANYTCDFIHKLYTEVGKGIFDCRYNILGHAQQGGAPSPFDRNFGTKLGSLAIEWLSEKISAKTAAGDADHSPPPCCMLGIIKREYKFTSAADLRAMSDIKFRIPLESWWMNLRPLMRIMAKHESLYECESIMIGADRE